MSQSAHTSVRIDNIELNEAFDLTFLGVTIDNKFKWKKHIDSVKSKLSSLTGIIFRLRNYINANCFGQIYLTLIYPHFFVLLGFMRWCL